MNYFIELIVDMTIVFALSFAAIGFFKNLLYMVWV